VSNFLQNETQYVPAARTANSSDEVDGTLKNTLEQLENGLIREALVRYNGNKKKVAERLGISRSYVYKKKLEKIK
jgi:transcriptional regulator with PAS, ATPase and Fis domain